MKKTRSDKKLAVQTTTIAVLVDPKLAAIAGARPKGCVSTESYGCNGGGG